MAGPYTAHLLYGVISNSRGTPISSARILVTTSIGNKIYHAEADGLYIIDIGEIGYVSGEVITLDITEDFNNELVTQEYTVTGFFTELNIELELRTAVENISSLQNQNVLHSVGKKPITSDNPLPTEELKDKFEERRSYDGSNRVEFIGEADPGTKDAATGWRIHKRSYDGSSSRVTKQSWAGFNSKFDKIWNDRSSYNYR